MRKIVFTPLLVLVTYFSNYAQNNLDSLKLNLANTKTDSSKADALYCIGDYYLQKSDLKALDYFNRSKSLYIKMQDTANTFYTMIMICDVYMSHCNFKNAFNTLNDSYKFTNNDDDRCGLFYNRLSLLYNHLGNNYKSMLNDKLTLKYYKNLNDSSYIATTLHNIGDYYLQSNNMDSAEFYTKQSIAFCPDSNDIIMAYNMSVLAFVERSKDRFDKAIKLHKSAIQRFITNSLLYETANEEFNLADYYNEKHLPDSMFKYINQSIEISKRINNYELLKLNYDLLYQYYKNKKAYEQALKYSTLKNQYYDSLEAQNKQNIIQNFEIKNKLQTQNESLEKAYILNKHLNKQRTLIISFSVFIFLLFLLIFYLYLQKRREQKKNTELLKQLDTSNNTLRTILSIIGHDLKESVGSLKTFTQFMHLKLLDDKSIKDLVTDFVPMVESSSDLLDNILTWSKHNNEDFNPVPQEVFSNEIIERSIIHVQHIASTKNIMLKVEDEKICFKADPNMMNTVLRNLITNAIKFSNVDSAIEIKACKKDNNIEFSVTDHGVGMTEDQIEKIFDKSLNFHTKGTMGEKGSGLGLSLCNSFIDKQNGKLYVVSKKGEGSTFTFSIPLQ